MEPFMKADIFFFISSVASIVVTVLFSILLYYLIKTAKNLHILSEVCKNGVEESEEFILELKDRLEGNMLFRLFFPPTRHKRSRPKDDTL